MLQLGNITLDVPFFQAALSGYSDYAMRQLAREFGAPLTFSGVMLAKSAAHAKVLAKPAFRPRDNEHPIGAQLLGEDPKITARAASALSNVGYDLIDLNFACPAPKVLRRGRGGALLNNPDKAIEICRSVRESVDCPVLMKLRVGFDGKAASTDKFVEIASRAIVCGIDALVIHGRTVTDKYRGRADWKILVELKKQLPQATIVGSGDLFDAEQIVGLLRTTGLDGVTIARGAIGNPWIFRDLRAVLKGKPVPPPPEVKQQRQIILKHFELVCLLYDKAKTIRYFRKFLVNYCKLHPQRKMAQQALLAAKDKKELFAVIDRWYEFDGCSSRS